MATVPSEDERTEERTGGVLVKNNGRGGESAGDILFVMVAVTYVNQRSIGMCSFFFSFFHG